MLQGGQRDLIGICRGDEQAFESLYARCEFLSVGLAIFALLNCSLNRRNIV